jgi:hypothetical protein
MGSKMRIFGLEASKGTSGKTGKAYEMGSIHVVVALAPPMGGSENVAKGFMGSSYRVAYDVVKRVSHLQLPFDAEVEIEPVMRFGKREDEVRDIRPVELAKKAA